MHLTVEQAVQTALGHHQAGRLAEAEKLYRQVLILSPDHAGVLHLLGILAGQAGRTDASIELIGRAIAIEPGVVEYHCNLAESYQRSGQWEKAIGSLRLAIGLQPDLAAAHNHLGIALSALGRNDEALAAFSRAIELRPEFAEAQNNLGNALRHSGRFGEAQAAYRRAVQLRPAYAEAYHNLGLVQNLEKRFNEAVASFDSALALEPDQPETHDKRADALWESGRCDEAIAAFRRVLALDPGRAEAHSKLGNALANRGSIEAALVHFRTAIELNPARPGAGSNLLYALHFSPDHDARSILAEHRRWDARFAAPLAGLILPHDNVARPDRRLRIGYVSADFRSHVVGHNLRPLFREHDHGRFEIFCYADVSRSDALTRRFQNQADVWRDILGRTDDEVARLVREDRIDILVDLALHMERNRLLVFARKPAPVQVTFAGYPGTTGLTAIGYRLTDPVLDPPGMRDADYAEESVRLPDSFWCYDPLTDEPAANALPALAHGFVTFGCLNHAAKVNAGVLALWARVIRAVEGSRLVLLSPEGVHRRETLQRLEQEGVASGRVTFFAHQPHAEYLKLYHGIDLALDTFPYNGHTTSLDALWMGVPVVTTIGRTAVGRAGLSQLTNLGMQELAAESSEAFVQIAVELAGDLPRLSALRANLRHRMRRSPLTDAPRFARGVEAAYCAMWNRWCARRER
jgi:predicted O-linked N-acetylglucosamine transferase (SPINDLY family)